jgi:hypothetical protein
MIAAVAIETADGRRIVDDGPSKDHEGEEKARKHAAKADRKPMQAEGVVQRALHGPKGEVRGALLEDGRMIRFPAHEAEGISELLYPGAHLAIRGEGLATEFGTVIEAREFGASDDNFRSFKPKKPKKPKHDHQDKHDDDAHTV